MKKRTCVRNNCSSRSSRRSKNNSTAQREVERKVGRAWRASCLVDACVSAKHSHIDNNTYRTNPYWGIQTLCTLWVAQRARTGFCCVRCAWCSANATAAECERNRTKRAHGQFHPVSCRARLAVIDSFTGRAAPWTWTWMWKGF